MNSIGIDIGGTKIFAAKFDEHCTMLESKQIASPAHETTEEFLRELLTVIHALQDEGTTFIGIAVAGFIDSKIGKVVASPNIPALEKCHLATYVAKQTSIPCRIANDATMMVFAEHHFGSIKEDNNALGISFGTGIGGGMLTLGIPYEGSNGFAGEFGHVYDNNGQTFEQQLGLHGLLQTYRKVCHNPNLSAEELENLISSPDDHILQALQQTAACTARLLYHAILILNPSAIVFSGGLGVSLYAHLVPDITEHLTTLLSMKHIPITIPPIRISRLANAGALGAALLRKA